MSASYATNDTKAYCPFIDHRVLFNPLQLGRIMIKNRIVMAPLTRSRATDALVPGPLAAEYYGQRASMGLIISEATLISPQGQGYENTPGIYNADQVAAWRAITDEVHRRDGHIFLQLWHCGRVSHTAFHGGAAPVAPSAVAANTQVYVKGQGMVPAAEPRALTVEEIAGVVDDYRKAAANAIAAGFDGVEIHAANGYLIDQFLRDGSNQRTDQYGGSIANRARFLLDVMQAVSEEIGADRVGVRLSPVSGVNDMRDSNPQALFNYVADKLNSPRAAYVHVVQGDTFHGREGAAAFDYGKMKDEYFGLWMLNNGYDRDLAARTVMHNEADMISFGRVTIANPDLVRRLQDNLPLAEMYADVPLYGGGGAHGYTDYPALP